MRLSEKALELAESLNVVVCVLSEREITATDKAQLKTALELLFGAINTINLLLARKITQVGTRQQTINTIPGGDDDET